MKESKNLDRLFQEKFKDFEADPDEQVWKNIEAALKKKKKRRVIPIWFRLAGVAALFLIGLFTFNQFFTESGQPAATPVQGVSVTTESNGASGEGISPAKNVVSQDAASGETGNGIAHGDNKGLVETDAPVTTPTGKTQNGVANTDSRKAAGSTQSTRSGNRPNNAQIVSSDEKTNKASGAGKRYKNHSGPGQSGISTTAVAGVSKEKEGSQAAKGTIVHHNGIGQTNSVAVAKSNKSSNKRSAKGNNTTLQTKEDNAGLAVTSGKTGKSKNDTKATASAKETNAVALQDPKADTPENAANTAQISSKSNEVIKDQPVKTNDIAGTDTKKDSLKQPNELEELLKKSQEKEEKTAVAKADKWEVTTNVAPVYFSSASGGSPIDQQFSGNSKSYETNMSYGVGVNYAVSKRLSLRAGINKFTVGYNTKDVLFYAGLESQNLGNITPSSTGSFIVVLNQATASSNLLPFEVAIKDNNNVGFINQQMGYIEVPMEMSYKILDSRFSVSVIGGLSTLFLNENEVSIHSGALTAKMGEANNLNDVHFSSNLGLGLRYRIMQALELHCEPTFKYQINTFSNGAGNFKPYLIGIYSGLSFSF